MKSRERAERKAGGAEQYYMLCLRAVGTDGSGRGGEGGEGTGSSVSEGREIWSKAGETGMGGGDRLVGRQVKGIVKGMQYSNFDGV